MHAARYVRERDPIILRFDFIREPRKPARSMAPMAGSSWRCVTVAAAIFAAASSLEDAGAGAEAEAVVAAAPDGTCNARKGDACIELDSTIACHHLWSEEACEGENGRCTWFGREANASAAMCRPAGHVLTCSDLPTPTSCATKQGCKWYPHATFCYVESDPFPCRYLYEAAMCELNGVNVHGVAEASDACTWDHVAHRCVAKDAKPACDEVSNRRLCLDRGCRWDETRANRCIDSDAPATPPPPCHTLGADLHACTDRADCIWSRGSNTCLVAPDNFVCAEKNHAQPGETASSCANSECAWVSDVQRMPSRAMCMEKGDNICKCVLLQNGHHVSRLIITFSTLTSCNTSFFLPARASGK
jgi:hypothetical protein